MPVNPPTPSSTNADIVGNFPVVKRRGRPPTIDRLNRPTKYYPEICQELINYFSTQMSVKNTIKYTTKSGTVREEEKQIANYFPTFEGFCNQKMIAVSTLWRWEMDPAKEDLRKAIAYARQLQKDRLINGGLTGLYNPQFTQFVARNLTDMRDTQAHILSNPDGSSVLSPLGDALSGLIDAVTGKTKRLPPSKKALPPAREKP